MNYDVEVINVGSSKPSSLKTFINYKYGNLSYIKIALRISEIIIEIEKKKSLFK